jgi:TnpA family transposase
LKLGVVQASGLIRTLQTNNSPTRLARALAELGRIIKTMHLLNYFDDEAYRRRILVQLNRGQGRHKLSRTVFHGKRGELRQRYRDGQKDQLSGLGLVVNIVVLWNTIYMDAAGWPLSPSARKDPADYLPREAGKERAAEALGRGTERG